MPSKYKPTGRPVGRPRGFKMSQASKDAIGRANARAWAVKYGELFPCSCGKDFGSSAELGEHASRGCKVNG